jgi:hypothetical protein
VSSLQKRVDLNDLVRMLDHCAEGHERDFGKHATRIKWQGKRFDSFPTGPKARFKDFPSDKVRSLVRTLGIDAECADSMLPNIGIKAPADAGRTIPS